MHSQWSIKFWVILQTTQVHTLTYTHNESLLHLKPSLPLSPCYYRMLQYTEGKTWFNIFLNIGTNWGLKGGTPKCQMKHATLLSFLSLIVNMWGLFGPENQSQLKMLWWNRDRFSEGTMAMWTLTGWSVILEVTCFTQGKQSKITTLLSDQHERRKKKPTENNQSASSFSVGFFSLSRFGGGGTDRSPFHLWPLSLWDCKRWGSDRAVGVGRTVSVRLWTDGSCLVTVGGFDGPKPTPVWSIEAVLYGFSSALAPALLCVSCLIVCACACVFLICL